MAVISGVSAILCSLAYLLAARQGGLIIASVLASQYPAVTALLSLAVLRERIQQHQFFGIGLALVSVALIAVG
jgi:uncharacterized membrane protein